MPVINRMRGEDEAGDAPPPCNQCSQYEKTQKTEDLTADDIIDMAAIKAFMKSMVNVIRIMKGLWIRSGLDHRFFYFITLIMLSNIMCGLLMMLEVVFHVRSHILTEKYNPIESFRSPLHSVSGIFCKKCYNTDYNEMDYEGNNTEYESSDTDSSSDF